MSPFEKSTVQLPSFAKVLLTLFGVVFALSLIVTPVYPSSTSSKPITVNLEGQSTLSVPANRATLSLQITSSGSSQNKVADEVRIATDDVLALLRPHTISGQVRMDSDGGMAEVWAPVLDLSVNTFSSQSRKRPGLLGEKDVYEAAASVSATFEADDRALNLVSMQSRNRFSVLSVVLAKLTKVPNVKIENLKWTVDRQTKMSSLEQVRTDAMQEAVDKIRAYAKPLLGDNVMVRAVQFSEGWRSREKIDMLFVDSQESDMSITLHDEFDGIEGGREKLERIALEPRILEVQAEVGGHFEVWVPVSEASRGSFWGWLRWCCVEFSALGAKVVLRR